MDNNGYYIEEYRYGWLSQKVTAGSVAGRSWEEQFSPVFGAGGTFQESFVFDVPPQSVIDQSNYEYTVISSVTFSVYPSDGLQIPNSASGVVSKQTLNP